MIVALVTSVVIVDTILSNISGNLGFNILPQYGLTLFGIFFVLFVIGELLLIGMIRHRFKELKDRIPHLRSLYVLVLVSQTALSIMLGVVMLQMLVSSQYSVYMPALSTLISHSIPCILFSILAYKFLKWYRIIRNYLLFIFAISFVTLAIAEELAAVGISIAILTKDKFVDLNSFVMFPTLEDEPGLLVMADAYWIFAYMSFVLLWFSIAMLMRHYSNRLGRRTFWLIVGIPLGFFITVILGVPGITPIFEWFDVTLLTIFFALNSTAGAILFAASFIIISYVVKENKMLHGFLIMSAFGFLLFFISDQAVVVHTPYPPFGLIAISFLGISSYYIMVGIYGSAISVSSNSALRKMIRKLAKKEYSQFLENIGMAEIQNNLEDQVINDCMKKSDEIEQGTGIKPPLSEGELRTYLDFVVNGIRNSKDIQK